MAKCLDSKYGKLRPYKNNPRVISDPAFTKLCASIEQDPEFMSVRKIIIDENNEILGGNQRQYALLSLGYERIPDDWVRQVTGWSEEKKRRFVLKDNSPEGMAGDFDYDTMGEFFSPEEMADSGIDFSNLDTEIQEKAEESAEERAEKSEYGEKNEKLAKFKENREKARESLDEMTDASFYLCLIFQNTEQKRKFIEESGLVTDGETFASGLALAEKMGIGIERVEYKFPEGKLDKNLVEMAMPNDGDPRKGADAGGKEQARE